MKMSQEQLNEFLETKVMPENCTNADVVEAMKERFKLQYGEDGETPNAYLCQMYSMLADVIGFSFGVKPKGNDLN